MHNKLTNILAIAVIASSTLICSESSAGLILGSGQAYGNVGGNFDYYPDPLNKNTSVSYEFSDQDILQFNLASGSSFNKEITYAEANSYDGMARLASSAGANLSVNQMGRISTFEGSVKASILWLSGDDRYNVFAGVRYSEVSLTYDFSLDTAHSFLFAGSGLYSGGVGSHLELDLINMLTNSLVCQECAMQAGVLDPGSYRISLYADNNNDGLLIGSLSGSSMMDVSLSLTDLYSGDASAVPIPASLILMLSGLSLLGFKTRRSAKGN